MTRSCKRPGSCCTGRRSQSAPGEWRGPSPPGRLQAFTPPTQEQCLSHLFSSGQVAKREDPRSHILVVQAGPVFQRTQDGAVPGCSEGMDLQSLVAGGGSQEGFPEEGPEPREGGRWPALFDEGSSTLSREQTAPGSPLVVNANAEGGAGPEEGRALCLEGRCEWAGPVQALQHWAQTRVSSGSLTSRRSG